jgi:hypothetical protein
MKTLIIQLNQLFIMAAGRRVKPLQRKVPRQGRGQVPRPISAMDRKLGEELNERRLGLKHEKRGGKDSNWHNEVQKMLRSVAKRHGMHKIRPEEEQSNLTRQLNFLIERHLPQLPAEAKQQMVQALMQYYLMMFSGHAIKVKEIRDFEKQMRAHEGKIILDIGGKAFFMETIYGKKRMDFMTEYIQGLKNVQNYILTGKTSGRKAA